MTFQLFGSLLVLGIIFGLILGRFYYCLDTTKLMSYVLAALLGARLFFVLNSYQSLSAILSGLIYWKQGGLSFWGAGFGLILVHLIIQPKEKLLTAWNRYSSWIFLMAFLISWIFLVIPSGYGFVTDYFGAVVPPSFVLTLPEVTGFHPLFFYSALFWAAIYLISSFFPHLNLLLLIISPVGLRFLLTFFSPLNFVYELYWALAWFIIWGIIYLVLTRFLKTYPV